MSSKIISSQHYLDDDNVVAKMAAEDYVVTLSPEFEFGGVRIRVVLDGHHSFAAARLAGVAPQYEEATRQTNDCIALLDNPEVFLEAVWIDGDYYDVINGGDVW